MKRVWILLALMLGALLVVAAVAQYAHLHGGQMPILDPAGPIALGERTVILIAFWLSSIVVIPVFATLFFFAWKYRADGPGAHITHAPNWDHDSPLIEFLWWLVPAVIIFALGILAWQSSHALDPWKPLPGNDTLTVEVVALDWKWLFIYPAQGIASVNELELPENVPVHFELTADAPMNSFWIPALGGQIMVMPGMDTQLNLEADKTGVFNGFSGNISGEGFSGMAFSANSVSQNDFDIWVAAARRSPALTQDAYAALAKPSENNPPTTYTLSDPQLFDSTMMKYMMPPMSTTP